MLFKMLSESLKNVSTLMLSLSCVRYLAASVSLGRQRAIVAADCHVDDTSHKHNYPISRAHLDVHESLGSETQHPE